MTEENLKNGFKEAGTKVLYEQLQTEYNKLLKQYAAAENTIDELRTGATVHLYTEALESRPNSRLSFEAVKYPQSINFPKQLQASTSSAVNQASGTNATGGPNFTSKDERVKMPTHGANNGQDSTLQARIKDLKEAVDTLESVLSDGNVDEATLRELLVICKQLHKEQRGLTSELKLQPRNNNTSPFQQSNFLSKTEMENELHRIGLLLEEIHSDIMARLKTNTRTSAVKSAKSQEKIRNDGQSLGPHLESLVKEMKDLKDASLRNSEEVLNSSRNEKARAETPHSSSDRRSNKERRRYSDPGHDMVDSRYFAASPETLERQILSGSESGSEDESDDAINSTSPPSYRMTTDSGIAFHSFSETLQDYDHDSRKSSPRSLESTDDHNLPGYYQAYRKDSSKMKNSYESVSCRNDSSPGHVKAGAGLSTRVNPSTRQSLSNEAGQSLQNTDYVGSDADSMPLNSRHKQRDLKPQRTNSDQVSESRRNDGSNSEEHAAYSDVETRTPENMKQNTQARLASPDLSPRKSNSMSSLADSSRMSTPLFQPRGATRLSPRGTKYKRQNPSDGCDSGFVGSEASRSSRLTTENPDGVQKLNVSNQWDSTLHLDLVSEMDENESPSSPEQMSTAYELTEDGRRSPRKTTKDHDSHVINSSPSPPSSPDRTPRTPTGYVGYRASRGRLPSRGNSLPGHDTALGDPSLSHISERPSLERRSSSECPSGMERTSRTRMDRRRISRGYSGSGPHHSPEVTAEVNSGDKMSSRDASNERHERKLQVLRHELDSLHDHVNKLDDPRLTVDMYDELRHHDEQLRQAYERRHERKLDELRKSIEQLKRNMKSRPHSKQHRRKHDRDPEFYDDFRSELRTVKDKLDELTALRITSDVPLASSASLSTHASPQDEDIAHRFKHLARKVEELRLRVENDAAPRGNSLYFCRLCHDDDVHHHSNGTVNIADDQPRTSTPFVSDVYREVPSAKLYQRSFLSSTYPGALSQQSPVVHHIHTYHKAPALKKGNTTDSSSDENDNSGKRTQHRKRGRRVSRYRATQHAATYNDHLSLDEARKAALNVQRLSKNILNSITLDLTSLRS